MTCLRVRMVQKDSQSSTVTIPAKILDIHCIFTSVHERTFLVLSCKVTGTFVELLDVVWCSAKQRTADRSVPCGGKSHRAPGMADLRRPPSEASVSTWVRSMQRTALYPPSISLPDESMTNSEHNRQTHNDDPTLQHNSHITPTPNNLTPLAAM